MSSPVENRSSGSLLLDEEDGITEQVCTVPHLDFLFFILKLKGILITTMQHSSSSASHTSSQNTARPNPPLPLHPPPFLQMQLHLEHSYCPHQRVPT